MQIINIFPDEFFGLVPDLVPVSNPPIVIRK